jgi:N-acyl-D-aspartate/D-glutamate deacylase
LADREKEMKMYKKRKMEMEVEGGWTAPPFFVSEEGYIIHSRNQQDLAGMTFTEIANTLGKEDFLEATRELLITDEGYTLSGIYPYSEEDIVVILRYPWTTVSTDQYAWDVSKIGEQEAADALAVQHPRGWGTYPKILGEYVRERKVLTIEEAIRKMTSLPAMFLGLQDRGLVKEGFWGDLVAFDSATVASRATFADPYQGPDGIPYVLVNGELAIDDGELTGALAGKVLKYSA